MRFSLVYPDRRSRPEVLLVKMCSENIQQIYRRPPVPMCDFNKVALQLYWNRTSAWAFSCKFTFLLGTSLDSCFCLSSKLYFFTQRRASRRWDIRWEIWNWICTKNWRDVFEIRTFHAAQRLKSVPHEKWKVVGRS